MRTSEVCPTCSTYTNALCVIYNGPYLSTLQIETLDDLETVIKKIETFAVTMSNNDIDSSLQKYESGIRVILGSNISTFKEKIIWRQGDGDTITLAFEPTNLLAVLVNGLELYSDEQFIILLPDQIQIFQELFDGDVIDVRYEHYATEPE